MDSQVVSPGAAHDAARTVDRAKSLARSPHARASATDLALVLGIAAATFIGASQLELHELFSHWVSDYERWQVDELPATLLALAAGLSWFAYRRWRDGRREIARRVRVEAEIRALLAQNRELAQRLISAQETERRALARELHDELGQRCNAIQVEAACILGALDGNREALEDVLAGARRIAAATDALYRLVHDMLGRLRPELLDSFGLVAAIQHLCESWEARAGMACRFAPSDVPDTLDDAVAIALFRAAQEGLSNVLRHSGASRVDVSLQRQPGGFAGGGRLTLAIVDNGRGFDASAACGGGLGLVGMRERVAALDGELAIVSAPGRGARLEISVPLQ